MVSIINVRGRVVKFEDNNLIVCDTLKKTCFMVKLSEKPEVVKLSEEESKKILEESKRIRDEFEREVEETFKQFEKDIKETFERIEKMFKKLRKIEEILH